MGFLRSYLSEDCQKRKFCLEFIADNGRLRGFSTLLSLNMLEAHFHKPVNIKVEGEDWGFDVELERFLTLRSFRRLVSSSYRTSVRTGNIMSQRPMVMGRETVTILILLSAPGTDSTNSPIRMPAAIARKIQM